MFEKGAAETNMCVCVFVHTHSKQKKELENSYFGISIDVAYCKQRKGSKKVKMG